MSLNLSLLAFIVFLLVPSCYSYAFGGYHRNKFLSKMMNDEKSQEEEKIVYSSTYFTPHEEWFIQQVDHTDVFNSDTFKQRYLLNDEYFHGDGPVFLCVGGEGPPLEDDTVTTGGHHCALMVTLAKETNGLILALEHRYYGPSVPTPDFSTTNMKLLSSQQALADISNFVEFIYTKYELDYNINRLTTWGGSYPGMMASFFRLKYPHQAYASVSSSAPVKAQAHFTGYMDVVGYSLSVTSVGGSLECQEKISKGFELIGSLLQSDAGKEKISTLFNVCNGPQSLASYGLESAFTNELSYMFPFQDNNPLCGGAACNYEKICKVVLEKEDDPVSSLARLAKLNFSLSSIKCFEVEEETNEYLTDTTLSGGTERVWFWQTCNEFGYYQTCDEDSNCPFTKSPNYNNLQVYYDQCELAFGITGDMIEKKIEYTNQYYGSDSPAGSRIIYVNGEVDPWSALSVLKPLKDEPAYMVNGASHHAWTHVANENDSEDLKKIREIIKEIVKGWLTEDIVVTK